MTPQSIPLIFAALAALWSALLAMTEGALAANPHLGLTGLPRLYAEKPERLRRGLAIGRICLITLVALALSGTLQWWDPEVGWLARAARFGGLIAGIIVVADLLPRLIGLWKGALVGRAVVRLTGATLSIPAPLFVAAGILDRAFARMFGVAVPKGQGTEIAQREMLLGVFALTDTMVSEVMTPRIDMVGIDLHAEFDDVVKQAAAAEYARLPVYDGDLDHIVGVLYAKDLLPARFGPGGPSNWQGLVRTVEIIPEVKTLDRQLRDFQRGPSHMAIVVDEFGGTAGVVTLEDVLEEIVGEIADEYDEAEGPSVKEGAPGVFDVDGRAPLDVLAEALGVPLEHEEVTTAGGFVYAALGHVPVAGETIEVAGFIVTIEKVVKRGIARLKFERMAPPEPMPEDDGA